MSNFDRELYSAQTKLFEFIVSFALILGVAACDSGELTRNKAKSVLNQELSGSNELFLIVCLTGDLSLAASNAERKLCIDDQGVSYVYNKLPFKTQDFVANYQTALMIAPHFEKMYAKNYQPNQWERFAFVTYYPSKDTIANGPSVVEVTDINDRFALLKVKNFSFSIGKIEGIREADEFERNCDKKVDFRYDRTDKAPWADEFIDQQGFDKAYSKCLVKYDDGWRVGGE